MQQSADALRKIIKLTYPWLDSIKNKSVNQSINQLINR